MLIRALRSAVVAAGLAVALAVCAPIPAPSEPSPLFSSDAEAFAAAEETYRAYVDALNGVNLSDPETFEAVYAWTTGEANAGERTSLSRMHADKWVVTGSTVVLSVESSQSDDLQSATTVVGCIDVSGVALTDAMGNSQVAPERPALQSVTVRLATSATSPTGMLISSIKGSERSCG